MTDKTKPIYSNKSNKLCEAPASMSTETPTAVMSSSKPSRLASFNGLGTTESKSKSCTKTPFLIRLNHRSSWSPWIVPGNSSNCTTTGNHLPDLKIQPSKNKQTSLPSPVSPPGNDILSPPPNSPKTTSPTNTKKRAFHSTLSSSSKSVSASDSKDTSRSTKKRVRFKPDHELVSYHIYPNCENWDHAQPTTSTSTGLYQEKKDFMIRLRQHRGSNLRNKWRRPHPVLIPDSYKPPWPKHSPEAICQQEREKVALKAVYISLSFVPPSPAEPDKSALLNDFSPIIPLHDIDANNAAPLIHQQKHQVAFEAMKQTPSISVPSSSISSSSSSASALPALSPNYSMSHLNPYSPHFQQRPYAHQYPFTRLPVYPITQTAPAIDLPPQCHSNAQHLQYSPSLVSIPQHPPSTTLKFVNTTPGMILQRMEQQAEKRPSSSWSIAATAITASSTSISYQQDSQESHHHGAQDQSGKSELLVQSTDSDRISVSGAQGVTSKKSTMLFL